MSAVLAPPATQESLDSVFRVSRPPRPYPGLRAFEREEWLIFFGRERMTDAVVRQLLDRQLVVMHGDSGCGKSSLMRAGVLPRLEQSSAGAGALWRTCTVKPGGRPMENLAAGLAAIGGPADIEERAHALHRALAHGAAGAEMLVRAMDVDAAHPLCILVDQFEELFEHARRNGPEEAQLLMDLLQGVFEQRLPGLYAAVTMRSEYVGTCARFRGFAETANATQYLLPRMGHHDMVRAICEPATLFGGRVTLQAAEWMIREAGEGQDQLPLIQHALMLMHRMASGASPVEAADLEDEDAGTEPRWQIDLALCERLGPLARQLSDHADAVMAEAVAACGPGGDTVVETVMRALTDINAEGRAIRRPCRLARLVALADGNERAVRAAIDRFRADGTSFLQPYGKQPLAADDIIDISHEALIRCWRKLGDPKQGWVAEEFRDGLVWRSLLVQADSFARDAENTLGSAATLERGAWLKQRNAAWAERHGGRWDDVQALMKASRSAREREVLTKRLLGLILIAALVGVLWWVVKQWWRADEKQQEYFNEYATLQTEQKAVAQQNLETLKDLAVAARAQEADPVLQQKVQEALNAAREQAVAAQAPVPVQAPAPGPAPAAAAPRVYFHISEASQRAGAAALQAALQKRSIGGSPIVVPGIELVRVAPPRSILRCFRAEECRNEAREIVTTINTLVEKPQVVLDDQSARWEHSTAIRARHYELWLETDVVMAAPK